MLYQVTHASKSFGAETVFEDVKFEIKNTEKITIVGRNGCGKTTFLRCLSGEMNFDKGTVSIMNGTTIGYLAQKVLEHEDRTVEEELRAGLHCLGAVALVDLSLGGGAVEAVGAGIEVEAAQLGDDVEG